MSDSFTSHAYLCSELVSIASKQAVIPGNLEAIDERSALVLTEVPLRRGLEISINASGNTLTGIVDECRFDGPLGWYVEVRLKPESWWSEEWFRPEHLLLVGARRTKVKTLENLSVTENFFPADHAVRLQISSGAAAASMRVGSRALVRGAHKRDRVRFQSALGPKPVLFGRALRPAPCPPHRRRQSRDIVSGRN